MRAAPVASLRTCVRNACDNQFKPLHREHICCSAGCWTAILHQEIGIEAAGMRPHGLMGDREQITGVRRKYVALATGGQSTQRGALNCPPADTGHPD